MIVPSSHFTRALRKSQKNVVRIIVCHCERKFASLTPVADKVFCHCFDLYRCDCAFSEQVVLSESVILRNFNFRNKGLVPIFKKMSLSSTSPSHICLKVHECNIISNQAKDLSFEKERSVIFHLLT